MSRVHSKEKEDKKPLECSICGKVRRSKPPYFELVIVRMTRVEFKPWFECELLQNFPRLSHLQRHQLIHIKEREWDAVFCEQSFCSEPHLMRHIGRCHASQYRDGLQEKVAANKWRTEAKPIDVEVPKKFDTNTPSVQQCSDLIPRMLCVRCGSTFDNRTDLDRHV
ncbi:hypothetical protein COOONC_16063, partial [Cooperia oncophora]